MRHIGVMPQRVGDRHVFADRREVEMTGTLAEASLHRRVAEFAEHHGLDLAQVRVEWEVRISAEGWKAPEGLITSVEDRESWLQAIARASEQGLSGLVVDVLDPEDTADLPGPQIEPEGI